MGVHHDQDTQGAARLECPEVSGGERCGGHEAGESGERSEGKA